MPIFMVCESFRMIAASRRLLPQERWRTEVRRYNCNSTKLALRALRGGGGGLQRDAAAGFAYYVLYHRL